jgi:GntR family transcriptional repressor for pyruvate dehydrogenase complex
MRIATLQRPTSLVEGVCHQLASLIRRKSTSKERWLPAERALAEQLGVSRGVVREATKRLEQQGMLEVQHGSGIKVVDRLHRPLNDSLSLLIPDVAERLRQLVEARLSIEPDVAAFAAQRATKAQVRTLRSIHARLENASDNEAAIACDLEFHHSIADASGNRIYRLVLDSLAELGLASRLRTIGRIGRQTAVEHHAKILEAIEAGDSVAARNAMRMHILAAGEDMDLLSLKKERTK